MYWMLPNNQNRYQSNNLQQYETLNVKIQIQINDIRTTLLPHSYFYPFSQKGFFS